ncbi:hypothetical protein ITI46_23700 [Streptomyces oryzae]|uniref:ArsR family transcriptional regulator n=1 Tax=Streptomyces oryzae TaxID=1434886 RepID=A0ABS3XH09_9ACTN|nr:hypothetical protein [Streptomyces oryzae]MBO8194635.1 hypothetical protein [Streptomyces oryzae]
MSQCTALRIARDLARRMDYKRGIVLYDLKGTAERLNMSVSNVKRHVSYLRDLGLLVWLEHGSKRNLHLPGRKYTATATIYGAVIPPAYDMAKGHRLRGEGYEATVVGVTERGREIAVAQAVRNAERKPGRVSGAPPSRGTHPNVPTAKMSGKKKTTRGTRARAGKSPRRSILGRRVTAGLYQAADRVARWLRPRHNWTQRARISELSWVLVDKIAEGCSEQQISHWLDIKFALSVKGDWRPAQPHRFIAKCLLSDFEHQQREAQLQADLERATPPNDAFLDAVRQIEEQRAAAGEEMLPFEGLSDLDHETQASMVRDAWAAYQMDGDPSLVTAAYEFLGPETATALYGEELVAKCRALAAHSDNQWVNVHRLSRPARRKRRNCF